MLVVLSVLVFLLNVRKHVGFWRLVFMVFPVTAVALDANFVILDVQNLSFGRLVASFLPPWGLFCQLGDSLGDHGSSRGDTWGYET